MQSNVYETALLARAAWQFAQSNSVDECLAIACVIRNHVRRQNKTYTQVITEFEKRYPTRDLPAPNDPALITPGNGLLAQIDGVYDWTMPDITSSHLHPEGAAFFGRSTNEFKNGGWFDIEVLQHQDIHILLGTFGAQQFFT